MSRVAAKISRCNYPEGYVPNGSPAEDALSKISVKLILDHRKVYDYAGRNITKVIDAVGIPGLVQVAFLPKLPPQKVGMHTVDVFWTSVEEICDGIDVIPDENCFATSEEGVQVYTFSFEVVSGAG